MKGKKHLFIGLVFGIMIGWVFGFLRFPYIEKNASFLLGFMASLIGVSLLFMILQGLSTNKEETEDARKTPRPTLIRRILMGVIVLGSIVSSLIIYRQNESLKLQVQNHDRAMQKMKAVVELVQKTNQAALMSSILEEVGEELRQNPARTLTNATINRIAALSFSFKSYPSIEQDSLSKKKYNKERGQLLQSLILMTIDSGSFAQIKRQAVFAEADLRGADLKGADLSGINLKEAHLKDANLSGANLKDANLGEANLWGANLNRTNLNNANLLMADLSWAQLNAATLIKANMNGASLLNAQLRKADLNHAKLQWSKAGGALFNEAIMTHVDLFEGRFQKGNFSQANLSNSDLRGIDFSQANLVDIQLNDATVDKIWSEKLKEWQPIGGKEISKSYTMVSRGLDTLKRQMIQLSKN